MAVKAKARRRQAKPRDPYHRRATPVRLGDERLRFTLTHGKVSRRVGDALTAVRWDDTGMELTGSLEAQAPLSVLRIADGDRLRCDYSPSADAPFSRLWTLAVAAGDQGIARTFEDESTSADLESTLPRYRANAMDFSYRRDKAHPKGWRCDQIVKDVARKAGLPLGKIAKGTHHITNLVRRNADPVDVILIAYRQEREATGRRFFITWNGRINITVLTRSKYLLELLPVITSGVYSETRREDFATVLDVRISAKKGKRTTRKVHTRVVDKTAVRQYGRIIKSVSPKGVDNEVEARRWGRESLKRRLTAKRELTITVPLMPTIRRGAAIRINWSEKGLQQVVYVRSASHEWLGGSGSTTLTLRFDDPFENKTQVKAAKAKAAKARKRSKPAPRGTRTSKPQPANRARRS